MSFVMLVKIKRIHDAVKIHGKEVRVMINVYGKIFSIMTNLDTFMVEDKQSLKYYLGQMDDTPQHGKRNPYS